MNTQINSDGLEVRVKCPHRGQVMMHMLSLDEMVRPDHQVRTVWDYVCSLDLSAFYQDIQSVKGGAGRDAVDPRILLTLWIYATIEAVGSARRLAKLCERDFVYMWICGEVGVNRDLLNSFRCDHPEALDELMAETIGILVNQDLINLKRIAQDGMRVRASAGKSSFRRQKTLEDHLQQARQRIKQLHEEDDDDDTGNSRRKAALERAARERLERVQQAIEERENLHEQKEKRKKGTGSDARCSTTDPEARNMKMANGGFSPAYNVQFATTCDSRIVVGVDVTNEGTDSGQMKPMVDAIRETFDTQPDEYLVDGGFNSREDVTELERDGIEVYAPIKKEQELLDAGKDPYERHRGDTEEFYQFRQRMSTDEAKTKYKERSSTAEFPNAGCRNRGLQQFPVRGKKKARTIAVWQAMAHNLQMIFCHGWMDKLIGG